MKGFAKTSTGETVYAIYTISSEQEKTRFREIEYPFREFTLSGNFREPDIPSHDYSFDMKKYMKMYGASGIFESERLYRQIIKSGIYDTII